MSHPLDEYAIKRRLEALKRDLKRTEDERAYFQRNYPSHGEAFKLFDKRIADLRAALSVQERALSKAQSVSPWVD